MKDSKKSSEVSRAPVSSSLRQVQILPAEDCHPKVGKKSKLSHAALPKNSLAWYVTLSSKPLVSRIPRIKWKCPPKFILNTGWHIAAGEGSEEAESQKCRGTTGLEVVYPQPSSPSRGGECNGNSQIPIIPIIPIEAAVEMQCNSSSSSSSSPINAQPPKAAPSVSGNLPLPEGVDLEVAVAAAATVAAVMESKQQIDPQLLIKLLTNPEMVNKLINENRLARANPRLPPASLALHCTTKVESEQHGAESAPPICRSRFGSQVPPFNNLTTIEPRRPIVRPLLMAPTLRPDEGTIKKLIKQYGSPVIASTPKPNIESMKKMNNEYGAAGIKPVVAPLIASASRPPLNSGEMIKMLNEYGVADCGSRKRLMGPNYLFASTPSNLHAFPNALQQSNFTEAGIFRFPSFSPLTTTIPPVDLLYCKSLIKQHGKKDETEKQKFIKFDQPGSYLQGLELAHNKTSIDMNPVVYQKPHVYVSSSKGCQQGSNFLYQHDVSKQ